jgi:predicted outer membrane repeat protein
MTLVHAALALALCAGAASAQSFNIDFNNASGAGSGVPDPAFGGPASQPGIWNSVGANSSGTVSLARLNGATATATLTRATNGAFGGGNSGNTTGDYERLLDDYQEIVDGTMTFTFNNLEAGMYAIFTCAADPLTSANRTTVGVASAAAGCQASQSTGGALAFNAFRAGVTHSVHTKYVGSGQPLTVTISDGFNSSGIISGMQLVKLGGTSARMRIYVDSTAPGIGGQTHDGGSWTGAFLDMQEALAIAQLGGGYHFEIWTASGFYKPTSGTDRSATFSIPSGLELYGGFAGTEVDLSERTNPLGHLTYLSGAIGGSASTDNSYTVVTLPSPTADTLIDGFFIASANNDGTGHGGGMVIDGGLGPTIRNCDFTTNKASLGGGAVYLHSASAIIAGCTFYNNDVTNGVGGAIESVGPVDSTATIQNSRFLGNSALGDGGAIYTNFVYADLANCFFSGNAAGAEGGAIKSAGDVQHLTVTNCTLSKNSAGSNSGGIYVSTGMDITMNNSILWGNTGGLGGAINNQQISVVTAHGSTLSGAFNTVEGLNASPRFVDADGPDNIAGTFDDDCRLQQSSPCIDAGDASALPMDIGDADGDGVYNEALPLDLSGQTRRVNILSVPDTGPGAAPVVDRGCYEFQLSEWCYANCDNSATAPMLNVQDFSCFLNKFAAGDAYANCDNSTTAPTLNVQDFSCFLNRFAAGCS